MKTDVNALKEQLKGEMKELLDYYEYKNGNTYLYKDQYLTKILEKWVDYKKDLLEKFESHPNYNGRGQIVLTEEFARSIDVETAHRYIRELYDSLYDSTIDTPEWNKYTQAVLGLLHRLLMYKINEYAQEADLDIYDYYIDMISEESGCLYGEEELLSQFKSEFRRPNNGQKMTKVIRKWLEAAGCRNLPNFEKAYAKISDALSTHDVTRYTILSVNFVDFLTMSFGNSWKSCHTIDKTNLRGGSGDGYSGCYSAGTMSYGLDKSSFLFYTIEKDSDVSRPEMQNKVTRCVFNVSDDARTLVQGRLYPQCNDGDSAEYKKIREIVQRVIAKCFSLPNLWANKAGIESVQEMVDESYGCHYHDLDSFSNVNVSFNAAHDEDGSVRTYKLIYVGNDAICPNCGQWHSYEECILCSDCYEKDNYSHYCERCGCGIDEDNDWDYVVTADNRVYCCATCAEDDGYVFCEDDDAWHHGDYCYWVEDEECYYYHDSDLIRTRSGLYYASEYEAESNGWVEVNGENVWYDKEDNRIYQDAFDEEWYLGSAPYTLGELKFSTEGNMCMYVGGEE